MKDLVDIFSDMPDEQLREHDYAHDPLDEEDEWTRFIEDWERED